MKFSSILALAIGHGSSSTSAFVATARRPATTAARRVNAPAATGRLEMMGRDSNFDLSGNNWKPDSEKMGVSSLVLFLSVVVCFWSVRWFSSSSSSSSSFRA